MRHYLVKILGIVVAVFVVMMSAQAQRDPSSTGASSIKVPQPNSSLLYTFLKVTTESLYNYSPGDYRIRGIDHLVPHQVIEIFTKEAKAKAEERQKENRRRIWTIREMRR